MRALPAAVAAMIVVLLVFGAGSALACSCVRTPSKELLRTSDGAAIARLLDVVPVEGTTTGEADFVYRLGRVYKGKPRLRRGNRLTLRSRDEGPQGGGTCGLPNRPRKLIGLFLERDGGEWTSNLCLTVRPRAMRRAARGAQSSAGPGC